MSGMARARIESSAGGVIFRSPAGGPTEFLLIEDSYGNWGFPKGHLEVDESALEAALRECREETGLSDLRMVRPLGTTDWYFRAEGELVHKFCDYFLLESAPDADASAQADEGIGAVEWLQAEAARERITYDNARHVLELGLEYLEGHGTEGRGGDR